MFVYFATCQERVVKFYQSCSSPLPPPPPFSSASYPPPPPLLLLVLLLLLRLFLLDHVCINFHLNFRLANSWPSSLPTLGQALCQLPSSVCTAGPQPGTFRAQCALLDLDLPSSVCTAGPQPGTFRAQCAPLDLNLGPSQLSVHCRTSKAR